MPLTFEEDSSAVCQGIQSLKSLNQVAMVEYKHRSSFNRMARKQSCKGRNNAGGIYVLWISFYSDVCVADQETLAQ